MNQIKNLIDTLMSVLVLTPSYFFSNFVLSLIYSGNPIMSTTASALGEKRIVSQVKDPPSIDLVIRSLKLASQKTSCSIQLLYRPTYKKDLIHSTTANLFLFLFCYGFFTVFLFKRHHNHLTYLVLCCPASLVIHPVQMWQAFLE